MLVQFGGPVEPGRGFVLHTSDYFSADTSLPIDERVALTATLDILRAIAGGQGPRRALLALGYAGWGPGQLEDEIQRNGWLHCAADEDLLFSHDLDSKYLSALHKIGVDPAMLSGGSRTCLIGANMLAQASAGVLCQRLAPQFLAQSGGSLAFCAAASSFD